ncbi:opticin [Hoplias malabaricus]|uniref:opticin n=1 Tax=Hoplias malabaricus TaxID=27720 RepID=UPI0034632144
MALFVAVVAMALLGYSSGAPPLDVDPATYDLEIYDVDTFELNSYDYDDLDEEIEVGTVAPPPPAVTQPPPAVLPPDYTPEVTLPPQTTKPPVAATLDFLGPGLFGPQTDLGMPTCLLCVCLSGSVYCDDSDLTDIPPLPKDTTYFYARFNKINEVKNKDFFNLNQLKRIDLTGNQISVLGEDAFRSLPQLQDLLLTDNKVQALPELPVTMRHIDIRNNRLKNAGMHREAFKDMKDLEFLYLSDNKLDYVPGPLPDSLRVLHLQNNNIQSLNQDTFCNSHDINYIRSALEDIRLDGNPVDINLYARAYVCLPRLPVGTQH